MKLRYLILGILVVGLSQISFAQELDWNLTGAGARAEGFGGAFIGIADDATAIVWNPAGLTQLERTEVSAVARYITSSSELTDNVPPDRYTVSNTQSHFNFNFGSIAVPFYVGGTNIVVAAAYQSQLDFYGKESSDTSSYESTGGGATFTPGVAVRVASIFSLGGAANIWFGPNDQTYQVNNQAKYPPYRGYTSNLAATFTGLNFVGGALFDFSGLSNPIPLKFGVNLRTPFTLKREDKITRTLPGQTFNDEKRTIEIDMPLMFGVGTSFRIGENFTVAADFEMRMFQDTKIRFIGSDGSVSSDSLTQRNENLNQVRVGAEYLVVFSGGVIPIRAGFRTVPTVLANYEWDSNQGYLSTGKVGGRGFTVGTGFISTSFALDFAYSMDKYDEQTYTGYTGPGMTDFTYNYRTDMFSGSLIVYF